MMRIEINIVEFIVSFNFFLLAMSNNDIKENRERARVRCSVTRHYFCLVSYLAELMRLAHIFHFVAFRFPF